MLNEAIAAPSLRDAYRKLPQLRPFIQYLAHAAVHLSPHGAISALEEILEASFANASSSNRDERRALREVARRYLAEIVGKPIGYLKVADTTGFSSFSFDEIYAKIPADPILQRGPGAVLREGAMSISRLVEMLAWIPELNLAIGKGKGRMDAEAVARVVAGWISGKTVREIAPEFPGNEADSIRKAGAYLFSTVSQAISWGAHAYIRGWTLQAGTKSIEASAEDLMLPAYIQHGVKSPEAAVAALLGVPRLMAESAGEAYRSRNGVLSPESVGDFKDFIESADSTAWTNIVKNSKLSGKVSGSDARQIWRRIRGLRE